MGIITVDASALIAILGGEPEASAFMHCATANDLIISPINYVETYNISTSRLHVTRLDALVEQLAITTQPTDERQAKLARDAYQRFGKGKHPAALNLADCFAYALAKAMHAPLLYKGDDFAKTDVESALAV